MKRGSLFTRSFYMVLQQLFLKLEISRVNRILPERNLEETVISFLVEHIFGQEAHVSFNEDGETCRVSLPGTSRSKFSKNPMAILTLKSVNMNFRRLTEEYILLEGKYMELYLDVLSETGNHFFELDTIGKSLVGQRFRVGGHVARTDFTVREWGLSDHGSILPLLTMIQRGIRVCAA